MKRNLLLLLVAILLLSGCATTNSIRIYEIGADPGSLFPFGDLKAGGCVVLTEGDPGNIQITYNSESCNVSYGVVAQ